MTPLSAAVSSGGVLHCWRIENERYFPSWSTAEGAYRVGGRFSSEGQRVLYTSLDPSTAILEVAVHKGFDTLDRVPHRLLEIGLPLKANQAYVLHPADVPNPNWLYPGVPSSNQQAFGDNLLAHHGLVIVPSVVSRHSWNCLISVAAFPDLANTLRSEERCGLDTRLIQLR